jgi:hypothetical protein
MAQRNQTIKKKKKKWKKMLTHSEHNKNEQIRRKYKKFSDKR